MNFALLLSFTRQELVDRYSGSLLGAVWTFILPLVNILIFTLVFSNIMGAQSPSSSRYEYSAYLVAGIITWSAFANTVTRSANVFVEKGYIIKKVKVLLPHLPLYIVLSESVVFSISLVLYIIFLMATGTALRKAFVLLPFIYIVQQIFAYALGFLFAIFNVFIRDIREFTNVLFQIWFWLTPIIYTPIILPEALKRWLEYNPAYIFIKAYHDIFIHGKLPDFDKLILLVIISHVLLMVAYMIFKKLEKDIRDFI